MSSFESFLHSVGLIPRDIVPGKWVRCATQDKPKKKNGSYKLAADQQIGWAINFAVHAEPVVWRPDGKVKQTYQRYDRAEDDRRQRNAMREAQEFYLRCPPLKGSHAYLEARSLSMMGCYGLKVDPATDALVVPMMRGREVLSVQRIMPDGVKRFWPGARTKGTRYVIDRPMASVTIICEGLATGLTLFSSLSMSRVIVAFSAGNLIPASEDIEGMCVVAADNDHGTEARIGTNPGVIAAQKAAERLGCGVAIPECQGTDWNDYYRERVSALTEMEEHKRKKKTAHMIEAEVRSEIHAAVMRHVRWCKR